MDLPKIYVKNNKEVQVSPKFVYQSCIYKLWKGGACIIEEKCYASNTPLDFKKLSTTLQKPGYSIQRFIELESAPEEYLILKGYKLKKV